MSAFDSQSESEKPKFEQVIATFYEKLSTGESYNPVRIRYYEDGSMTLSNSEGRGDFIYLYADQVQLLRVILDQVQLLRAVLGILGVAAK